MHELSIAMSIVEMAQEEGERRGVQVNAVHLKLGALSGVVKEALLSSYEMACADTPLQGSRLIFEEVPVVVFCPTCQTQRPEHPRAGRPHSAPAHAPSQYGHNG